jgi:hypothetical protein
MSKNVIIFGARKFGVSNTPAVTSKYPNTAVITVEPSKEGGRSRRVLFNAKASEVLNLEMSEVQQIVFGFVEGETMGLIANASLLGNDVMESMTTYRTSKNKVSFESTKERGKAISSIANEIANYYGLDNSVENEFSLESFDTDGVESFSMSVMKSEDCCGDKDCTQDGATDVNSNNEVIDQDVTFEEVQPEQPVQAVEPNDSNFNIHRSPAVPNAVETEGSW